MDPRTVPSWGANWLWSLPLIAATVVIHCFGLALMYRLLSLVLKGNGQNRFPLGFRALVIGGTALFATILHGIEAAIWAGAYLLLGAIPDRSAGMLYSLGAMTSYGHADINLESRWQLMGPLETLDGWILFGITTAVLMAVVQKVWRVPNSST